MKGMFGFLALVLFIVLAVLVYTGLSAIFAPPSWEQQQLTLRIERDKHEAAQARAAALEPWVRLFFFSLLVAGAVFAVGASTYGVYHLFTRPVRVKADDHGIFPVEVWRTGNKVLVFDPNRSLSAGTVLTLERRGVDVVHCVAPGQEDAQRQAATQGAAIQAIRAGVSGVGLDDTVHTLVERLLPGAGAGFPPVQTLPGVDDVKVSGLLEGGPEEG